jgi:hypothetical protein
MARSDKKEKEPHAKKKRELISKDKTPLPQT